jgi:limonene-1,2-epoxide hydrolase
VTTAEQAERIVRDLLSTLETHDTAALRPFFTDDVVYHNIPMDPSIGIEDSIAFIDGFVGACSNTVIDILHVAVRDNVVLTERVDSLTFGDIVVPLPVMGTFEIRDGKVSAWRDYFDMAFITNTLAGEA